ncbi:MAG: oligosaccharide flippase family protein [Janthinobacterium lividum]
MKQQVANAYKKLGSTNIISNFFNLSSIQLSNTLLLILSIPIITRKIGIEEFGIMMFASRFMQLAGTVINYGTNQSGVRDVASNLKNVKMLSKVFYNTFFIRLFIFLIFLFLLPIFHFQYSNYILLALPLALAEVVNPLFFFIGAEKLKVFNIANLICNIFTIATIIIFINKPQDAGWVNFILGGFNVFTYSGLLIYLHSTFKIKFSILKKEEILAIAKTNFYLTVNNISVQLQQSIMIFALTKGGNTFFLGAYSLCDRIIGQCRNLLITISNAVYPNTVKLYQQSTSLWNVYRKKTKYLVAGVFFAGSLVLFFLADFIIFTLSKEHNATAVIYLKTMALVPTISALNFLNVLDLLLKNNTVYIFRIAVILLIISIVIAFSLLKLKLFLWIGLFTLIIEICALLMYEYMIKKPSLKNA